MSAIAPLDAHGTWPGVREQLRSRGLRWTPQRRMLVDVLSRTAGHVTGAALVEACRTVDPETTPSTVYRTLDVLEELGLVSHSHGVDGREEYHVRPSGQHGHLVCTGCGGHWEVDAREAAATILALRRRRGFEVDLSHLTIVGRCAECSADELAAAVGPAQARASRRSSAPRGC